MTAVKHPPWCDPEQCTTDADGVVLHRQTPARLTNPAGDFVFCGITLVRIEGLEATDATTYIEVAVHENGTYVDQTAAWLTLDQACWLRDRLGEHLTRVSGGGR